MYGLMGPLDYETSTIVIDEDIEVYVEVEIEVHEGAQTGDPPG